MESFKGKWDSMIDDDTGRLFIKLPVEPIDNFNTVLHIVYDKHKNYKDNHDYYFEMRGNCYIKLNLLNYTLSPLVNTTKEFSLYLLHLYMNNNTIKGEFTSIEPIDYGSIVLYREGGCLGCFEKQPNQLAHMDNDSGCLKFSNTF